MKVKLVCGDITGFDGDAIVNAANPVLMGGGGVDGAIHRAAGPKLKEHCMWLPSAVPLAPYPHDMDIPLNQQIRCLPGFVRVTPAFDLPCQWVFHTVGPIFDLQRGGDLHPGETTTLSDTGARVELARCFKNCGRMMQAMGLKSIAFPAISTGVYGCPHEVCAQVAHNWATGAFLLSLDVTFYLMPEGFDLWLKEFGPDSAFGVELP